MTGLENYLNMAISHCICQGSTKKKKKKINFQLCTEQGKGERETDERGKGGEEKGERKKREKRERSGHRGERIIFFYGIVSNDYESW